MPQSDVVIIGAGAIGCSIAYHLGKRGMRAVVVERESIGTRASGKAWGVIPYPPSLLAYEEAHRAVENPAAPDSEAARLDTFAHADGATTYFALSLQAGLPESDPALVFRVIRTDNIR